MNIKILEIRDEGTCMPVLALQMKAENDTQAFWLGRAGYPRDGRSITLVLLSNQNASNDPFDWGKFGYGPRTMPTAHQYIITNWDTIKEGDVIDVSFILGERSAPQESERGA